MSSRNDDVLQISNLIIAHVLLSETVWWAAAGHLSHEQSGAEVEQDISL